MLLLALLAAPNVAETQAAQAVRVGRDTGSQPLGERGGAGAQSESPHRYGPPQSVRQRDAQLEASVPAEYAPPAGMCRLWVRGVPADRQPAPTECAKAVRVRSPNSQIVFGKSKPTTGAAVGVPVAGGGGGGSLAEPLLGNRESVGGAAATAAAPPHVTVAAPPAQHLTHAASPPHSHPVAPLHPAPRSRR